MKHPFKKIDVQGNDLNRMFLSITIGRPMKTNNIDI